MGTVLPRRLTTASRAMLAQLRGPAPPSAEALDLTSGAAALERVGARATVVRVAARAKPWTRTGLRAERGTPITWMAHGDSWIGSRRGPHVDAATQIHVRTGLAAPALRGTGDTHTAPAPHGGAVEMCCLYPGEFDGPDERIVYDRLMPRFVFGGGFDVIVATWPAGTDVASALDAAAGQDPTGLCAKEAARFRDPLLPPAGWSPHPRLPLRGVHTTSDHGIVADSRIPVEIICRDVRAALTPTVSLSWRWRVDRLPSDLAENTLFTHDYLSIAVEFDDGTDLTWYWSASLPPGTSYRCPLPHWRRREWHLVVRSGTDGLGEWQQEERLVAPDRAAAIGGPEPRGIVRAWLIATTFAQGDHGRASYADAELVDGDRRARII